VKLPALGGGTAWRNTRPTAGAGSALSHRSAEPVFPLCVLRCLLFTFFSFYSISRASE
jgi:hypothetical protein